MKSLQASTNVSTLSVIKLYTKCDEPITFQRSIRHSTTEALFFTENYIILSGHTSSLYQVASDNGQSTDTSVRRHLTYYVIIKREAGAL